MTSINTERLQPLLDWKRKLDEELRELRCQRDELNAVIVRKEAQARNLRELLESEGYLPRDTESGSGSSNGSVGDAAYEVIKKTGQPMTYRDVTDRLLEAGVSIPGRSPQANLLAHLVRDQRFQRVGRGTYALAEWGLRPKRIRKSAPKQNAKPNRSRRRA